jgi:hypothetical protein
VKTTSRCLDTAPSSSLCNMGDSGRM